jgi:hypothetical protein
MKPKTWLHLLLHLGCVALLLLQGHRIQQLRQSEIAHRQKALQVRGLFFECTNIMDQVSPGITIVPDLQHDYWKIIGPVPNW